MIWADRTIHWNADVVSLGADANTVLKINADGSVDPSSTITPTITATQIIVPDIGGAIGGGTITFVANDLQTQNFSSQETAHQLKGILDGTKATFYYPLTLDAVTIRNASTKQLIVNNIAAFNALGGQTPNVTIDVNQDDGILDFGPDLHFPPSPPFNSTSPTPLRAPRSSTSRTRARSAAP